MNEKPVFLMSPPRRDWALRGKANFRSREAGGVDAMRAREEWATLADAIVDAGGEVLVCPPHPRENLTGMIYMAEAGEFYRDDGELNFLLPNMATEHRRPEASWIGGFMEGLGFRTRAIDSVWEAQGDAIRGVTGDQIVHTYGEGPDARTEADAYDEVADLLSDEHIQIRFDADPWFHGNTFMNIYRKPAGEPGPEAILMVTPEAMPEDEYHRLADFLSEAAVVTISREASRGYDTNSLQVGDTIIAPDTLSKTAESAFVSLGLEVRKLDLGELFVKGGGAPVCLTDRLWGLSPDALPERVRWSARPSIEAHTEY